jgi:survival-of-motor-neuron-related-splicing factor 30
VWAIGAQVQALYSADGQWYPGVVQAATADGKLLVLYEGYNSTEELPLTSVQLKEEEEDGCARAPAPACLHGR